VVEVIGDDRLSLRMTSPAWPGACPGWPGAPTAWPPGWPPGRPCSWPWPTGGDGTGRRFATPAPAGPGAARTGTSPTPQQVSALVTWHGASTGSAGSGPPGRRAVPGEHGTGPADRAQNGRRL